jgi:hypothetical protein
MNNTFSKKLSILYCFSSQTVSETEADSKPLPLGSIPNLTRSRTIGSTHFTVPEDQIEAQVGDTTVKISRTQGSIQLLEDILEDFPDDIREIVAARIQSQKENK